MILPTLNFVDIAGPFVWPSTPDTTCGTPLVVVDDDSCALFHFKNDVTFNFIQVDIYVIDFSGATTYYSTGMMGSSFADVLLSVTPCSNGLFLVTTRGGLIFTANVANFKLNNSIPIHVNFGLQITSPCQGNVVDPSLEGVWFDAFSSLLTSAWHTTTGGGADIYNLFQVVTGGALFELTEGLSGPPGTFNQLPHGSGTIIQQMNNGIAASGSNTVIEAINILFDAGILGGFASCGFSPPVPNFAGVKARSVQAQAVNLNPAANQFGALFDSNVPNTYGVRVKNFGGLGADGSGIFAWSNGLSYVVSYAGSRANPDGNRQGTCVTNKWVFDTTLSTNAGQSMVGVAENTSLFQGSQMFVGAPATKLANFTRPISILGAFKA